MGGTKWHFQGKNNVHRSQIACVPGQSDTHNHLPVGRLLPSARLHKTFGVVQKSDLTRKVLAIPRVKISCSQRRITSRKLKQRLEAVSFQMLWFVLLEIQSTVTRMFKLRDGLITIHKNGQSEELSNDIHCAFSS